MTREEAGFILANIDRRVCDDELNEALDMAIKALEQEPILDKIRAEVPKLGLGIIGQNLVLELIDKYRKEQE